MMNMLKKKLNKKGFTLAELLIVVAIIAVLVAVSIPIFTSKLEKTREETDIANMRAAKAAVVAAYLNEEDGLGSTVSADVIKWYDADAGILSDGEPNVKYGKGTATKGGCQPFMGYTEETVAANKALHLTIKSDGTVTMSWGEPTTP